MGSYCAYNGSGTHTVHCVWPSPRCFTYTGEVGFSVYTEVNGIFTPQYWKITLRVIVAFHVCVCVCVCMCIYVCTFACIYVCIYVCMYVCMDVYQYK